MSTRLIKSISAAACALFLAVYALTAWNASLGKCATYDEPLHLVSAWTENNLDDYRINTEDPPLWKHYAILGLSRDRLILDTASSNWQNSLTNSAARDAFVSDTLFHTPANNPDSLLRDVRLHMVFLGVALGVVIAWWSWRLAGPIAAVVATAAYSLDPNFLAHASLLKNDVPITLIFTALMGTIWLAGERATALRCIGIALLLGIAIVTKFSGLLAIPIIALALLARAFGSAPWPVLRWTAKTRLHRFCAAAGIGAFSLLVAWLVTWACYDFRFSPGPASDTVTDLSDVIRFCALCEAIAGHDASWDTTSDQLVQLTANWQPGAIEKSCLWLNQHRLLPQSFIHGFLFTYATTLYRGAFFCGKLSFHGWWYYFPAAMAFKTPLATLVALFLALAAWLWMNKIIFGKLKHIFSSPRFWPFCAAAILPIYYMASAMRSHINLGLRHVFPVYPFLFIFLGVVAAAAFSRFPRFTAALLAAFIVALTAETFCAYPDYLSFFNVAVGGQLGGAKLLGDSNIDWGQDLKTLVAWRAQHPEGQLCLAYFGTADPRYYGLHYDNLPSSFAPEDQKFSQIGPHYFAISVTLLEGAYMSTSQHKEYLQFFNYPKAANLGGSIYVYESR
jgi:hypothetical protein